jgi:Xaa-Pro aminopeptidase
MLSQEAVRTSLSKVKSIPGLNFISPSSTKAPTKTDLEGFQRAQALAYEAAVSVGQILRPGMTERQAAALVEDFLADHGVKSFFHTSMVWFGDRSRFAGFKGKGDALPGRRALQEGGEVICIDTAPIVDGYCGDIGFTFALEPNPELVKVREYLLEFRRNLRNWFASDMGTKQIWEKVDADLKANGYDNIHARYTYSVLGHRVHKMPFSGLKPLFANPYTQHAYWAFMSRGLWPEILTPWHDGEKLGFWALEPHVGAKGFGAKFEEILVVENGNVRWLDDAVPHVQLPKGLY